MSKLMLTWALKPLPSVFIGPTPYNAIIQLQREVGSGSWETIWETTEYNDTPYVREVDSKNYRYRVQVRLAVFGRVTRAISNEVTWASIGNQLAFGDETVSRNNPLSPIISDTEITRIIPNVLRPTMEDDIASLNRIDGGNGYLFTTKFSLQAYTVPEIDIIDRSTPLQSINISLGTNITRSSGSSIGN